MVWPALAVLGLGMNWHASKDLDPILPRQNASVLSFWQGVLFGGAIGVYFSNTQ